MRLTYEPEGPIDETLMFAGKVDLKKSHFANKHLVQSSIALLGSDI